MGHDLTAIKDYEEYQKFWNDYGNKELDLNLIEKFKEKNEIAYLRRNMSSRTIIKVYEFLGCVNNYNGVSGDGNFIIVALRELKEAREKVKQEVNLDKEDKTDYLYFINKCISYCLKEKKRGVIIHFG